MATSAIQPADVELKEIFKKKKSFPCITCSECQGLTQEVPTMTEIRLGDSMRPILFNLIMDKIIQCYTVNGGYRMGQKAIKILCHADDAMPIAENEDDLHRQLCRFQRIAEKYNIQKK
ncbi:hypothetical protein FQA39_LY01898 [Lamprigera yunnana]|nr:hypothetical protein FQA39_LY01898 [Lamprigera yunnana]